MKTRPEVGLRYVTKSLSRRIGRRFWKSSETPNELSVFGMAPAANGHHPAEIGG
jgi:hypothetical protein